MTTEREQTAETIADHRRPVLTEGDWQTWTSPVALLKCLGGLMSERKYRLFACACYRRMGNAVLSVQSRQALEVAERYADGMATWGELASAVAESVKSSGPSVSLRYRDDSGPSTIIAGVLLIAEHARSVAASEFDAERAAQTASLHCLLGNPFRRTVIDPAVIAWNDSTVRKIALGIYEDHAYDRLPILADALEDAGCANLDLLSHCRSPGEHVRGCWAVDLLLGKR